MRLETSWKLRGNWITNEWSWPLNEPEDFEEAVLRMREAFDRGHEINFKYETDLQD